jgi:hypothetical protein
MRKITEKELYKNLENLQGETGEWWDMSDKEVLETYISDKINLFDNCEIVVYYNDFQCGFYVDKVFIGTDGTKIVVLNNDNSFSKEFNKNKINEMIDYIKSQDWGFIKG